ncbi:hypothetical protein EG329_004784 [Mollisiaceae sp. DMI_Dod_QoI]|nr:hypothetical protein EG329_004784 [Helotiales sp. DMI_Dod_QoI]
MSMLGPIWIDALSINQEDKQERQEQVGLMSKIYKGARRVLVWLGKDDHYTAPALEYLKRSKAKPAEIHKDLGMETRMYYEANFTDEEFESIICFLGHRRWFSRLWTIQETVLAQELSFLCGEYMAPLERIWAGASALRYRQDRIGLNPAYYNHPFERQVIWAAQFHRVGIRRHRMLQDISKLDCIGLNTLAFCHAQATDLRDKVFGLIGISRCHHECLDEPLVADYDLTVQEVFTNAARFALLSCPKIGALSFVQNVEEKTTPYLPSWVPDLAVERVTGFNFEESYLEAATTEKGSSFTLDFDGDVLVLAASLWDRVVEVGDSRANVRVGFLENSLKVFLNAGPEYSFTKESISVAMRRTLIADRLHIDSQDKIELMDEEYDLQAAFDKLLFRLICWALKRRSEDDNNIVSGSNIDINGDGDSGAIREISSIGTGQNNTNQNIIEDRSGDISKHARNISRSELRATSHETELRLVEVEEERVQDDKIQSLPPLFAEDTTNEKDTESDLEATMDAGEQAALSSILESFLKSPADELPEVMKILGFPNITDYAPLEASILDGARLCQYKLADFTDDGGLFPATGCHLDPYANCWYVNAYDRIPFRTERGYVGLAIDSVSVGDDVYLVEGAGALYILRPKVDSRFAERTDDEDEPFPDRASDDDVSMKLEASVASLSALGPKEKEIKSGGNGEWKSPDPFSWPDFRSSMEVGMNDEETLEGINGNPIKKNKAMSRIPKQNKKDDLIEDDGRNSDDESKKSTKDDSSDGNGSSGGTSDDSGDSSRESSYEDGGSFTLGGEVYVHGIMYGEAFADGNEVVFKKVRIY